MKTKKSIMKVLVFIMLLFLKAYVSFGQGWQLGGNASGQTTEGFGTTTSTDVSIVTDGEEREVIQANGTHRIGGNTTSGDSVNRHIVNTGKIVSVGSTNYVFGNSIPEARLDVNAQPNATYPAIKARIRNTVSQNLIGLHAISKPANGYGYGIQTEGGRRAIYALNAGGSYSAQPTYGVFSSSTGTAGTRYGIYGTASGNGTGSRYGVYGIVSGTASGGRYGIYGKSDTISPGASFAGYFEGRVTITGLLTNPSDRKLKEKLKYGNSVLNKLLQLKPAEYYFKEKYISLMSLPRGKQFGLVADETELIFPELVTSNFQAAHSDDEANEGFNDEISYKGINYIGFVPILIQSIKEQQEQIITLKSENDLLKSEVSEINKKLDGLIKSYNNASGISKSNELKLPHLEQNEPNPFSKNTVIRYSIPIPAKSVIINIYNQNYVQIRSHNVPVQEHGSMEISGPLLNAGEYIYELIVDGERVDSKKMILIP